MNGYDPHECYMKRWFITIKYTVINMQILNEIIMLCRFNLIVVHHVDKCIILIVL